MKYLALLLAGFLAACSDSNIDSEEMARWRAQARDITIIRDDWGVPHIFGKTDADTVFGAIYAQAEDDFNRIEINYLNAMGRLSEAEGEEEIFRDLRMKLFIRPEDLQQQFTESPEWLKELMVAWADGLNYFLATHPSVEPRVIKRFEPWMALSFTEGSIGGDIETISLSDLESFYGNRLVAAEIEDVAAEPGGSNGFAIAPQNTVNGNALFLINPHTSFYFRAELHMVSDEGLNAYGASTWGQFFVYQGFNENLGWMHTSSAADAIDEYAETIIEREEGVYYLYEGEERRLQEREIAIPYRTNEGSLAEKSFTAYFSHHGPIIRAEDGKWISIKLMQENIKALTQSYARTKASNYPEFYATMELNTNSSNNTVYADRDGNIAYFHGNFIPRRDPSFNWNAPLDGSLAATEWQGLHPVEEHITLFNPANGWIMNTNNWPFSAAGEFSPKREDYPLYMSNFPENYRGLHATKVLTGVSDFTLESLHAAAYDSYLIGFDYLLPPLFSAYDGLSADAPERAELEAPIKVLRAWDRRSGVDSIETSLAIFWGRALMDVVAGEAEAHDLSIYTYMESAATDAQRLSALREGVKKLENDFGSWQTPWGEINRFQRLTGDIVQPFDDNEPSIPVGFTSARWGSLAAYGQRTFNNTKRIYGTRGNSFVAVVEFGETLRAKAVSAGGQSGNPRSPHFNDQAPVYSAGDLRDVYFYPDDIRAHMEKLYHPGE